MNSRKIAEKDPSPNQPDDASQPSLTAYYHLAHLDCADCARKLENKLKRTPGIIAAEVNFAAAKMKIVGSISPEAVKTLTEKDGIAAWPVGQTEKAANSWLNRHDWVVLLSGAALAAGWLLSLFQITDGRVFFLSAIAIGGGQTFRRGLANLRRGIFDMNVLMTVAVIGAVAIGEWQEGAAVAFLFAVSQRLESFTADRARRSLRGLMAMTPKLAAVIKSGRESKVPVADVCIGDQILVRPGEIIPVDGQVSEGFSSVNQAPITGESLPVSKETGSPVFAGSINQSGALTIQATRRSSDSVLAQIVHLVEEAQNKKVNVQSLIDRFAAYYTPAVMILAGMIMILPPLLFGGAWHDWLYRGLTLLVIACPCALVITTPVVVVSAIGNAARHGVLIKGGSHLERLAAVTCLAFDKTGTLTKGMPKVQEIIAFQGTEAEVIALAASVEQLSEHPLAAAVVRAARQGGAVLQPASQFQSFPGRGGSARVAGQMIRVGSLGMFPGLADQPILQQQEMLAAAGNTVIIVGREETIIGLIALADEIRPETLPAIRLLQRDPGMRTVMLTGDNHGAARTAAENLGLDEVHDSLLPQGKIAIIERLKKEGHVVMMIGDGINDAPAMAAADLSVAMGVAGSDVALDTADIALMSDDLQKIPDAIALSRRSLQVIKQNISLALLIKFLAIIAVFPGWMNLWLAIMADMGANVLVTMNSMRLVGFKHDVPLPKSAIQPVCTET